MGWMNRKKGSWSAYWYKIFFELFNVIPAEFLEQSLEYDQYKWKTTQTSALSVCLVKQFINESYICQQKIVYW